MKRERSSLLQALECFQDLGIPRGLTAMTLFLYICENEGLIVTELADVAGWSASLPARRAKALAGQIPEVTADASQHLVEMRATASDGRLRQVFLSPRGR